MSDNISSISRNVSYLPPRVDKRTPEERERDKAAVAKSAAKIEELNSRLAIKMHEDDFEPGQLKCPDCPVTFSNKANLYKHLAKQHRTQVETIKGRCYKGGRRNANLRYYEKKKIEKTLANQDSDSMTATQLRNQRYYRQKMLNEAVTITRAHILDTLFVDFDEELSKLPGDKLKMIRDSRKFHFTNYYEDMEVQYKLIIRYTDVPDTYHSRIAIITIILDFLHLVFPSNIKKDYDAKRVVPMLVGIDVEDMPETLALGESNEKHKDELKKFLLTKSNNLGTCRRIIMSKLTLELLHRCFAASDYIYASVRSNCVSFLSLLGEPLVPPPTSNTE